MLYPNPSDPLNGDAASLMMKDKNQYEQKVKGDYLITMAIVHVRKICYVAISSDTFFHDVEYCERYAKKENLIGAPKDESDSDEEISEEEYSGRSDSDDEVVGHADP